MGVRGVHVVAAEPLPRGLEHHARLRFDQLPLNLQSNQMMTAAVEGGTAVVRRGQSIFRNLFFVITFEKKKTL